MNKVVAGSHLSADHYGGRKSTDCSITAVTLSRWLKHSINTTPRALIRIYFSLATSTKRVGRGWHRLWSHDRKRAHHDYGAGSVARWPVGHAQHRRNNGVTACQNFSEWSRNDGRCDTRIRRVAWCSCYHIGPNPSMRKLAARKFSWYKISCLLVDS